MYFEKTTIVLIGLDEKMLAIITTYLSSSYHIIAVHHSFNIEKLDVYRNIQLFIIDVDTFFLKIDDVLDAIKKHPKYKKIPKIGLSLKRHHASMDISKRKSFEDFILMPCGNEDLLTRIEVWIKTYQTTIEPVESINKSYPLESLN